MSWVSGIKEIKLLGMRSVTVTIPKADLEWFGCFYPLAVNGKDVIDAAFSDVDASAILGKGNYALFASELGDFDFESLVWANYDTKYDEAIMNTPSDINVLYGFLTLDINTVNEYTDVESNYRNIVTLVVYTDHTSSDKQLRISLGGFYSPAQDMIFSNFNDKYRDVLFHEATHAITRAAEDLLRYTMYGGSESSVKEEIMTHLVTDKFKSFKALESFINESIKVEYEVKDNWKKPVNFSISSGFKDGNISKPSTDKATFVRAQVNVKNQVVKLNGSKYGMIDRDGMKALRKIQFGDNINQRDKNKYKSSLGKKSDARRKDVIAYIKDSKIIGKSGFIKHDYND